MQKKGMGSEGVQTRMGKLESTMQKKGMGSKDRFESRSKPISSIRCNREIFAALT